MSDIVQHKKCIDCDVVISKQATRCKPCAISKRHKENPFGVYIKHPEGFWKGMERSDEDKSKMSDAKTGLVDEQTNRWKGDDVGYDGLHDWVYRKLGRPGTCEDCGKNGLTGKNIHWANISGEYKRELNDWKRLCVSCHHRFDKSWENRERNNLGQFV